jgi:DNA mismatch repair protein PMS2
MMEADIRDCSKRNTLLSTDGKGSLRSAVTSIWGTKALEGVLDVNLDLAVEIDPSMARREGLTELWVGLQ